MDKVRWGVLSTADIGMAKVTPAIQQATNSEVIAIASRDEARAAAAAAELGIPNSYGSYEALLAATDVDVVYIPLPNDMHAVWTMKAAAAGKHVLCEKPLAVSAAQAGEMAAACKQAGVKLAEAFMYRHHPMWVEAMRLVNSGAIGELVAVQSWFSYFNDDPNDIRNRTENHGGALMDIGCYNINLSRMLFGGEPMNITSTVRRDPVMGIDIATSAILEFAGGGQSTFTCTIRSEEDQRVHIAGSSGRIDLEVPFNMPPNREAKLHLSRGGDPPADPATETISFAPVDQYTLQAEAFAAAILDDTEPAPGIADAIANMAVIEQILGSG